MDINEIAVRRRTLGITQVQLAKEADISQSLIAKLESGKINPSYSVVVSIEDALDRLEQKEKPKAFSLANKNMVSLKSEDKVGKAVGLMRKKGISQIPIIDRGKVVGSISERLIITHEDYGKGDFHNEKISKVMGEGFPILPKNSGIDTVSHVLRYSSAVLLSERGKIVGIITKTDLLKTI
jgi:predicted transcriptional regulator